MQDDFFSLDFDFLVEQGIDKLREYSREKFVHYIYAIDSQKTLLGILSIRQLAISSPKTKIKDVINKNIVSVNPWQSTHEAADIVSHHNFIAILASSIISLFEQTMSRLIILATLKNVVAGIGGNTAIQTLTVTTRGLDTGDFHFTTFSKALAKELLSGLIMGSLLGLGAGIITYFWKKFLLVASVIFFAMTLNSLVAVLFGFITPIFMRKLKKDPAVSSSVIVTVITDIFGFFIFLSMASAGLKFFGESL